MKVLSVCSLLFAATALPVSAQTVWMRGNIRDIYGKPLGGLEVHLWRPAGTFWEHRMAVTGGNGGWSLEVPAGDWLVAPRPEALLARGYFCVPGSIVGGGGMQFCAAALPSGDQWLVVPCDPGQPPGYGMWGPGVIEWQPGTDPGNITLIAVPTRPELSVVKSGPQTVSVAVGFETQNTVDQQAARQWRIEKSTDLAVWTPITTVSLAGPSPQIVPDPSASGQGQCYYRAVMVGTEILIP